MIGQKQLVAVKPAETASSACKPAAATKTNASLTMAENEELQNVLTSLKQMIHQLLNKNSQMESKMDSMNFQLKKSDMMQSSLQARCKTLESRCHELEDTVKDHELIFDYQDWEYSANGALPIPNEYWISKGYTEEYANAMTEFVTRLEEYSHRLQAGETVEEIELGGTITTATPSVPFLAYDEILLPHWVEFGNAMLQCLKYVHRRPHVISKVRISNIELPREVLDILSQPMSETSMNELILENNHFHDREGMLFVLSCMENDTCNLKELALMNNEIACREDIVRLSEIVRYHHSLERLTIKSCCGKSSSQCGEVDHDMSQCGEEDHDMLSSIIMVSKKLKYLNLSDNCIGSQGAALIFHFLCDNPRLKQLILKNNRLNNMDVKLISRALKGNTKLQLLDLEGNVGISPSVGGGGDALLKAVFDSSSLNSVATSSNHTCHIHCPQVNNELLDSLNNRLGPQSSRKQKIGSFLLSKYRDGSLVSSHLELLPCKLMPDVLGLLQEASTTQFNDAQHNNPVQDAQRSLRESDNNGGQEVDEPEARLSEENSHEEDTTLNVEATSLMFEVLRHWKMPVLYSYR